MSSRKNRFVSLKPKQKEKKSYTVSDLISASQVNAPLNKLVSNGVIAKEYEKKKKQKTA